MDDIGSLTVDPVCGDEIDPEESDYKVNYQGRLYYFCSLNCQLDFQEAPDRYVDPDA